MFPFLYDNTPFMIKELTLLCLHSCLCHRYGTIFSSNTCSQSTMGKGMIQLLLKSVQSALSELLTTSATHGTFSRPSTKRGLILIGLELNTNARESFEHC